MNRERELRDAFAAFLTGVTVITTVEPDGTPRGFTANSFTSVSLDPPLVLVCIDKSAASRDVFTAADGFAVSVLSETQKDVSNVFATKRADKFQVVAWREGPAGHPVIEGASAWFDCVRHDIVDAGDHVILIGRVEGFGASDANPLGYARGGYFTFGLEAAAADASAGHERTVVGAVLECDGRVLLIGDPGSDTYRLPEVGRRGRSGTASQLRDYLTKLGAKASLGFVFAVFEAPEADLQLIYYRGQVVTPDSLESSLFAAADIPWDKIADAGTQAMLRRYFSERELGSFGVYSDHDMVGEIRRLAKS